MQSFIKAKQHIHNPTKLLTSENYNLILDSSQVLNFQQTNKESLIGRFESVIYMGIRLTRVNLSFVLYCSKALDNMHQH